jgi:predicted DCC family thiol-disulfide oxidoreductase YuxK
MTGNACEIAPSPDLAEREKSEGCMTRAEWSIEVLYDGACPLCRREVDFIQRRDRRRRIRFIDIAAADFAVHSVGIERQQLMERIHGRLPNGQWLTGVEVFRHLYRAIGLGWVVELTRWPIVATFLDWLYAAFARRRLKLSSWVGWLESAAVRCLPLMRGRVRIAASGLRPEVR